LVAYAGARGHFEPDVAQDTNPDPDIVEVALVATKTLVRFTKDGPPVDVWTYNGSIPGPTIKAKVGDTLIVHFFNFLPAEAGPTTVHWHGVEAPANMDGSNIAQLQVPVGGYFRYEFKLLRAAAYWYHPHIRSFEQIEKGLYGILAVRDPYEDAEVGLPKRSRNVVLDDVLLDENGQIAEPLPDDPVARAKMLLDGREGNTLLVNGREGRILNVRIGKPQRWRLTNVSNARVMRVSIPGHRIWRVGGDGGMLEHPIETLPIPLIPDPDNPDREISAPDPDKGILLYPGERADVIFTPMGKPGTIVPVEWHDFPRGRHFTFLNSDGSVGFTDDETDGKQSPIPLMYLRLKGKRHGAEFIPPENLREIEPIDPTGAESLVVTFGHTSPDPNGDVIFFADRQMVDGVPMPLPFDAVTPEEAQDVFVGETRIWEITNLTGSDHPFHTHGWFFQPLEIEYVDMDNPDNNFTVPFPFLENKDTIRVPKRPGAMMRSRTIVRAAVLFDDVGREGQVAAFGKEPSEELSGGWVFHCHVLEHATGGMMSFFEVFE
jgi:FtsP/CotA-like multicopper oxidase with cupredoxin domain